MLTSSVTSILLEADFDFIYKEIFILLSVSIFPFLLNNNNIRSWWEPFSLFQHLTLPGSWLSILETFLCPPFSPYWWILKVYWFSMQQAIFLVSKIFSFFCAFRIKSGQLLNRSTLFFIIKLLSQPGRVLYVKWLQVPEFQVQRDCLFFATVTSADTFDFIVSKLSKVNHNCVSPMKLFPKRVVLV